MTLSMTKENTPPIPLGWKGQPKELAFENEALKQTLLQFDQPLYAVSENGKIGLSSSGSPASPASLNGKPANLVSWLPALNYAQFGDPAFCRTYGVKAAYYAGGMANAIASEKMVITLGKAGLMGSFGSGGLGIERLQQAIEAIQAALPNGPYMFNLLHNPFEPDMEQATVETFLKNKVRAVEAAAYVRPDTPRWCSTARPVFRAPRMAASASTTTSWPRSRARRSRCSSCIRLLKGCWKNWLPAARSRPSRPNWHARCPWRMTSPWKPIPAGTPTTSRWLPCCPAS